MVRATEKVQQGEGDHRAGGVEGQLVILNSIVKVDLIEKVIANQT